MSELSSRIQSLVVMLCTSLYAADQDDQVLRQAATVLCRELKRQLTGRRPTDREFRAMNELGEAIADGGFPGLSELDGGEVMMPYCGSGE